MWLSKRCEKVVRAGTYPVRKSESFCNRTSLAALTVLAGSAADASQKADGRPIASKPMAENRIVLRITAYVLFRPEPWAATGAADPGSRRIARSGPRP